MATITSADYSFNTPSGQRVDREALIAFLNTGTTASPKWSPVGRGTDSSAISNDYSDESVKDILGNTDNTMKKPIQTQDFEPLPARAGDAAIEHIIKLAVIDQDVAALANQDMMIVHRYLSREGSDGYFAERYSGCMVKLSSEGGDGGSYLNTPISVTYGGTRTQGDATQTAGAWSFAAWSASI